MTRHPFPTAFAFALLVLALVLLAAAFSAPDASASDTSPFAVLAGRWTGEGRLGLKESPPETVKCRATYFITEGKDELKQNIRCATAGGSIEVKSEIQHTSGALTGKWQETTRNIAGDLTGSVTPNGFRVAVRGGDISANMDIIVRDNRQLIEIQFLNSSLVGLSLLMTKG